MTRTPLCTHDHFHAHWLRDIEIGLHWPLIMPSLLTLHKELLLRIISFLPFPIIETLAKTHNHHITSTCLAVLHPLFVLRRHIKLIQSRFDSLKQDMGRLDFEIFICETAKFGLSKAEWRRVRQPVDEDWFERMEWLDLTFNNSLDWLQTGDGAQQGESGQSEDQITTDKILKLEQEALQAGLRLPESLIRLFKDQALLDHMPRKIATSFYLSDAIVKAPSTLDNDAGGYILAFCIDPDWENTYLLYLTTDGKHCVLSQESMDDHGDIEVAGVGFDEWLVTMVFEQQIEDVVMENRAATERLKEYVRVMYVRRPEEMKKPTRLEKRMVVMRGGKVIGPAFPD
ncbi:hypothetical protein FB567DRAFT_541121 [Paraphoma chrysanthemicola]|uniref:Uncharacterized protein n=1 Tax=Paraphoma chrysanthemicola TaxID=798071 RepID=A0A8K0VRM6_9PLEO|nr:hypothetical protein FB567DRAFT_541121 [Paraphoma chrysanthemicola]